MKSKVGRESTFVRLCDAPLDGGILGGQLKGRLGTKVFKALASGSQVGGRGWGGVGWVSKAECQIQDSWVWEN